MELEAMETDGETSLAGCLVRTGVWADSCNGTDSVTNSGGCGAVVAAAVHLGRIAGRPQLAAGSWGLQAEILGARMGWSGGQRGGAWGAGASRG